jgi:hypothetical protein
VDQVDCLPDRDDRLGFLVGDLDVELVFEGHEELDDAEAVHIEVLFEVGVVVDLRLIEPQLGDEHPGETLRDFVPVHFFSPCSFA